MKVIAAMPRRRIGQETLLCCSEKRSSLDEIDGLIDWAPIERRLEVIHSAPRGEASWPPLAMFRGMLLAVWYDLSDVKLADALDDRAFVSPVLWLCPQRADAGAYCLRPLPPGTAPL
ncbi:MAG: transposase [Alphaproteobacteria bacterium]